MTDTKRETGQDTLVSPAREKTDDSTQQAVHHQRIGTETETHTHSTIERDNTYADTASEVRASQKVRK